MFGRTRNPDPAARLTPNGTRVQHEDYGVGTVQQVDGQFLMILFDGQLCPAVGIHVDDVTPAN